MKKKKKEVFRRFRLPIRIIWFIPGILGFGGFLLALSIEKSLPMFILILIIFLCYTGSWIYLTLRTFRFKRRMTNYLRRLLSGDYSTGIHDVEWISDEITVISNLATKVAEHLEAYDHLRADRTAISSRSLEILFRRASRKIIMADFDKSHFKFTKPLQHAFGVDQDTFSFGVLEKQKNNTSFFRKFYYAAFKEMQEKEFSATLELPIRQSSLELKFKFVPIKDKAEKVRIAFLYVDKQEDDPDD